MNIYNCHKYWWRFCIGIKEIDKFSIGISLFIRKIPENIGLKGYQSKLNFSLGWAIFHIGVRI